MTYYSNSEDNIEDTKYIKQLIFLVLRSISLQTLVSRIRKEKKESAMILIIKFDSITHVYRVK